MISASRAALSLALGTALVLGLLTLQANPPAHSSFYPPCVLHKLTGLHCPGCGSTRSAHELLNGHVSEAANKNLLFLIALPFLVWSALRWWARWVRGLPPRMSAPLKPWLASGIAFSVIAFAVLRNLPWPPFSYLAPR